MADVWVRRARPNANNRTKANGEEEEEDNKEREKKRKMSSTRSAQSSLYRHVRRRRQARRRCGPRVLGLVMPPTWRTSDGLGKE